MISERVAEGLPADGVLRDHEVVVEETEAAVPRSGDASNPLHDRVLTEVVADERPRRSLRRSAGRLDAELTALGVGEHPPALDLREHLSSEPDEPLRLGIDVGGA
jgi:hypothetical protein